MADRVSPEVRSRNMSRIRSRDTKPEKLLRKALYRRGLRYRLCRRDLPGTPDIIFPSAKLAVQVRGCFWHQHEGCRHSHIPKSNRYYWVPKLERTVERDSRNDAALMELGWDVIVVWECELAPKGADATIAAGIHDRLTCILDL